MSPICVCLCCRLQLDTDRLVSVFRTRLYRIVHQCEGNDHQHRHHYNYYCDKIGSSTLILAKSIFYDSLSPQTMVVTPVLTAVIHVCPFNCTSFSTETITRTLE